MEWNDKRCVAAADSCALSSLAFAFPTEGLTQAVSTGEYQTAWDEAYAVLVGDDGASPAWLADSIDQPAAVSFEEMRREYSRLYELQGSGVLIWPYESCFRYRAKGGKGMPGLFRTPTTMAVEESMRRAGVQPVDSRTEPADSISKELAFLSLLFRRGCEGRLDAANFLQEHVLKWAPAFMAQTAERTGLSFYRLAAEGCAGLLAELEKSVEPLFETALGQ